VPSRCAFKHSSAIEKALHACSQYPFSVVFFAGPATYHIKRSVVLRDSLTLLLDKTTTVFYDNKHYLDQHNTSTLQQTAACGIMGFMENKNTPVICGKDLNNTAVVGTDSTSVIDGGGWNWWGNHTNYGKGPQAVGIMTSRRCPALAQLAHPYCQQGHSCEQRPNFGSSVYREDRRIRPRSLRKRGSSWHMHWHWALATTAGR
jgi:hypothetical protein